MLHFDPISLIYDAALGESSWDDTLDAISAEAGHAVVCLGIGDPRNPQRLEVWTRGFDPWWMVPDGFAMHDICSFDRRHFVSDEAFFDAPFMRHFHEHYALKAERLYVPLREGDHLTGGFIAGGAS